MKKRHGEKEKDKIYIKMTGEIKDNQGMKRRNTEYNKKRQLNKLKEGTKNRLKSEWKGKEKFSKNTDKKENEN